MKQTPWDKIVHRAKHIRPDGAVSALCFTQPRKIDLKRSTWTLDDQRVNCPRCREIIDGARQDRLRPPARLR
jgi:hypothetical protein